MAPPPNPSLVFISYSHEDEIWKNLLVQHLRVLKQEGALDIEEDCWREETTDDRGPKIETALTRARVAILLLSADFLNSGFMHGWDVPELLQRRETTGLRVIPVIIRPCAWQAVPWLAKIQCWPVTALASLPNADVEKHLSSLALEIRDFLKAPPSAVAEDTAVAVSLAKPVKVPTPLPPPVLPQAPPSISQPLPAPRRSRSGLFLGIGCTTVLAILALASLGHWLSQPTGEVPSTDAPPTAATPTAETPATDAPPSDTTTTAAEVSSTDASPSGMTTTAAETEPAPAGLGGQFLDVWVEHNLHRWGRRGMLIHSRFIINGARQDRCRLIAYFHDASGNRREDFDESSETGEGQVTVANGFTPKDDPAKFEDLTLFMPYAKLNLAPGINRLKFLLQVQRRSSGEIAAQSSEISLTLQR